MSIEFCIPPNHPALPGHFPDNPIVPAVVIIQEVARRLTDLTGRQIDEVRQLRLQQPVLPGQRITMSCEPRGSNAWRVTLAAEAEVLARGVFAERSESLAAPEQGAVGGDLPRSASAAYRLLPHADDMALIDTFETDDIGKAHTSILYVAGHPLEEAGHLLPWVSLEYAVQLYGCHSLLSNQVTSSGEAMGGAFIVMVRTLRINVDRPLRSGQRVDLTLQVLSEQGAAAQCEFDARVGADTWCRGAFTVVSGD